MQEPIGHVHHVTDGQRIDGDAIVAKYLIRHHCLAKMEKITATFVLLGTTETFDVIFSSEITFEKRYLYTVKVLSSTIVHLNEQYMCMLNLEFSPQ